MVDIIIGAIVFIAIALACIKIYRNSKNSGCSCGCSGCSVKSCDKSNSQ